ncbi:MAG: hypothetical protein V3R16_02505 [Nitrospirales bacterium]
MTDYDLPILVLEFHDHEELSVMGAFANVKLARKWIREEANPGGYFVVRKVEEFTVAMEKIEQRVVR